MPHCVQHRRWYLKMVLGRPALLLQMGKFDCE
jgi:hypothetical protein